MLASAYHSPAPSTATAHWLFTAANGVTPERIDALERQPSLTLVDGVQMSSQCLRVQPLLPTNLCAPDGPIMLEGAILCCLHMNEYKDIYEPTGSGTPPSS